jgi:hypothetical protein
MACYDGAEGQNSRIVKELEWIEMAQLAVYSVHRKHLLASPG